MCTWMMISLQDSNSYYYDMMVFFYDLAMVMLVLILMMIMYLMSMILFNSMVNRYLLDAQLLEVVWTVIPMFILLFLAVPSLKLLYFVDDFSFPLLTIKTIGHQWYWSYEYSDIGLIEFDSFMLIDDNMKLDLFRLLDVDNRMVVPMMTQIRLLVSSLDVIHAWAMPSLGMKVDAVPGRINQLQMYVIRPGLYFGQCSEICGANHSFMPIVLESTNMKSFLYWINNII